MWEQLKENRNDSAWCKRKGMTLAIGMDLVGIDKTLFEQLLGCHILNFQHRSSGRRASSICFKYTTLTNPDTSKQPFIQPISPSPTFSFTQLYIFSLFNCAYLNLSKKIIKRLKRNKQFFCLLLTKKKINTKIANMKLKKKKK